ncbi:hypothetical protein L596_025332 [Steinernema carpocapsae]|uniref:Protein kinase domain-containing protein n=1 Tax=Steinernema carpocapsae TaxID=34508 RepID=A0A4V5ZYS5_STECR|nr:hypothetical protein L596_025332 [Steinernema carpocapsae]
MAERFEQYDFEYNRKDMVGHGAFAVVYKGRLISDPNTEVAIKVIDKKNIQKSQSLLKKEIRMLTLLSKERQENVVSLLNCKWDHGHVYLVMEYCNHGDLSDYLIQKKTIPEDAIQHFVVQIARAIEHLNKKNIVHRDLKPHNILLNNPTTRVNPPATDLVLKLADFGFARTLTDGGMAGTLCGSPMYMAPEVITSMSYCAKADLWSIGTIIYQSLTGKAPFPASTPQQLKLYYEKQRDPRPNIPPSCSENLRDLLMRLLKKDAKLRIEFEDFFTHPFLNSKIPEPPSKRILDGRDAMPSPTSMRRVPSMSSPRIGGATTAKKPVISPSPTRKLPQTPAVASPRLSAFQSRPIQPLSALNPNQMSDSSDFTFLPPLPHQQHFAANSPYPVKQVQVHSAAPTAALNVRAVPVPNQRLAFAKMEEKRNGAAPNFGRAFGGSTTPRGAPAVFARTPDAPTERSPCTPTPQERPQVQKEPSIEQINPPMTQFVVCEAKSSIPDPVLPARARRYTVNDLTKCSEPESSSPTPTTTLASPSSTQEPGPLPKSATSASPLSSAQNPAPAPSAQVDNIKFLTSTPQTSTAPLPGPSSSNATATATATISKPPLFGLCDSASSSSESEDEEDYHTPIRLPFVAKSDDVEASSNSLMQDSASVGSGEGDDTSATTTTTSSGVYSAAVGAAGAAVPIQEAQRAEAAVESHVSAVLAASSSHSVMVDDDDDMAPPPALEQETILEAEHRQVLSKLRFVLELVETLMTVAENKSNPIAIMMEEGRRRGSQKREPNSDAYRRAEQLVVYVRALHMLSSALLLAQKQVASDTLHPSPAVQHVLNQLNDKYHQCLVRSQELASLGLPGADPSMAVISAERIMYKHAIELCQAAALDELFGQPQLCPKRYQTAYMMLHTLSEQVQNEQDRSVLAKYKNAVEKRLRILERQGLVTAVTNS